MLPVPGFERFFRWERSQGTRQAPESANLSNQPFGRTPRPPGTARRAGALLLARAATSYLFSPFWPRGPECGLATCGEVGGSDVELDGKNGAVLHRPPRVPGDVLHFFCLLQGRTIENFKIWPGDSWNEARGPFQGSPLTGQAIQHDFISGCRCPKLSGIFPRPV